MSPQILELLIFAAIAIFIVSKLISILGSDGSEPKNKSYFGENPNIKEVQSTVSNTTKQKLREKFQILPSLKGYIVDENKHIILESLRQLSTKLPSFNPQKFIKSAKAAFIMIIGKEEDSSELVDVRYQQHFNSIIDNYGYIKNASSDLDAKISEIYTFGNNVFVKVLFTGKNITSKIKDMHEEWTFTKSVISSDPIWHLSNIDRPQ